MPEDVEADDKGRGERVDDGHARLDLEAPQPAVYGVGFMGWVDHVT